MKKGKKKKVRDKLKNPSMLVSYPMTRDIRIARGIPNFILMKKYNRTFQKTKLIKNQSPHLGTNKLKLIASWKNIT